MAHTIAKTLTGLVGPSGSGGSSVGQSNEWNLTFYLVAWRAPDAEIVTQDRLCIMPVAQSDVRTWMERVKPYSVIEVEIEEDADTPATKLRSILRTDVKDTDLTRIADELQKPIVIQHPVFGELQYERAYHWYSGQAVWNGETVRVTLSCRSYTDAQAVLDAASHLFTDQIVWRQRVKDYAVKQLLELKNDSWLDEDEAELSEAQFVAKMTLDSIDIDESGSFTFWHDDGNLFFGHSIQISGDFANGLTLADIPG